MNQAQKDANLLHQVALEHTAIMTVALYLFVWMCIIALSMIIPLGYAGIQVLFHLTDMSEVANTETHTVMLKVFIFGFSSNMLIRGLGDPKQQVASAKEYLAMRKKQVEHLMVK